MRIFGYNRPGTRFVLFTPRCLLPLISISCKNAKCDKDCVHGAAKPQPAAQPHPDPVVARLPGTSRSRRGGEFCPAATARALPGRGLPLLVQVATRPERRR